MTNPPKDSSDVPEKPSGASEAAADDASEKPDKAPGTPGTGQGEAGFAPPGAPFGPERTSYPPTGGPAYPPTEGPAYPQAHGRPAYPPQHGRSAYPAPYGRTAYPPPPPYVHKPTKLEKAIVGWKRPALPMSPALVAGTAVAGVIGAVSLGPALRDGLLGVGVLFAATAVAYLTGASAWAAGRLVVPASAGHGILSRLNRTGVVFILLALGLSATAAVRDAGWIVVPAVLLAIAAGSYGASGGRSWAEVMGGGLAVLPAVGCMMPWAGRGAHRAVSSGRGSTWPIVRTGLIAAGLLAVFGGLFIGADAAFGSLAAGLVPEISPVAVVTYVIAGGVILLLASAGAFLGQAPPPLRMLNPEPAKPAGRWSWAVPIATLDLLFLVFCIIQAGVFLASDKDKLLRSTGLTYAEYARQGFFQLVIVTVLVLAVVAVAMRYAPSAGRADRVTVRVLLGLLCALTLVVVAVALRRLYLYEETFGWTRLRLWVHAFELWLGAVIVLVAVAGVVKGRVTWLPRAVAASGAIAMIVLASIDPDGFIAEHNVDRYRETGKIDVVYLRNLSADAVPALDRLPEPQRSCALRSVASRLKHDDPIMTANHSRNRARAILDERPIDYSVSCATASRS